VYVFFSRMMLLVVALGNLQEQVSIKHSSPKTKEKRREKKGRINSDLLS